MEYIDGVTLDKYITTHTTEETFTILDHCVALLNSFPSYGFHHDDLSPRNILVIENPSPNSSPVMAIDLAHHEFFQSQDRFEYYDFFTNRRQERWFVNQLQDLIPYQHWSRLRKLVTGRFTDWGDHYNTAAWEFIMSEIWGSLGEHVPLERIRAQVLLTRWVYQLALKLTKTDCKCNWPIQILEILTEFYQWDHDSVIMAFHLDLKRHNITLNCSCGKTLSNHPYLSSPGSASSSPSTNPLSLHNDGFLGPERYSALHAGEESARSCTWMGDPSVTGSPIARSDQSRPSGVPT